jgi:hypothetical protein
MRILALQLIGRRACVASDFYHNDHSEMLRVDVLVVLLEVLVVVEVVEELEVVELDDVL